MDFFQFEHTSHHSDPQYRRDWHNERMASVSLTLAIVAVISCTCLYISIPCGALAIILGILSRGGQMTYSSKAQVGIVLGAVALICTIVLYTGSFLLMLYQYGSIEGILDAYEKMSGMNYNEMFEYLYQMQMQ